MKEIRLALDVSFRDDGLLGDVISLEGLPDDWTLMVELKAGETEDQLYLVQADHID